MSQKQVTRSKKFSFVEQQVEFNTPESVIDAIAVQLERAEESAERIKKEGSVVRDLRGAVIAHPSIQIELNAMKIYADLLKVWHCKG